MLRINCILLAPCIRLCAQQYVLLFCIFTQISCSAVHFPLIITDTQCTLLLSAYLHHYHCVSHPVLSPSASTHSTVYSSPSLRSAMECSKQVQQTVITLSNCPVSIARSHTIVQTLYYVYCSTVLSIICCLHSTFYRSVSTCTLFVPYQQVRHFHYVTYSWYVTVSLFHLHQFTVHIFQLICHRKVTGYF